MALWVSALEVNQPLFQLFDLMKLASFSAHSKEGHGCTITAIFSNYVPLGRDAGPTKGLHCCDGEGALRVVTRGGWKFSEKQKKIPTSKLL